MRSLRTFICLSLVVTTILSLPFSARNAIATTTQPTISTKTNIVSHPMDVAWCTGAKFIFPHPGDLGWPYMDAHNDVFSKDGTIHRGIDIWGLIDDEVRAVYPGKVTATYDYTKTPPTPVLRINHPDLKVDTYYGHVTPLVTVTVGLDVKQGDVIGTINESGHAGYKIPKGSHVHFVVVKHDPDRKSELFFSSSWDPSPYLNAQLNYYDQPDAMFFTDVGRIYPYTRKVKTWCNPESIATGGITGVVKTTDGKPVIPEKDNNDIQRGVLVVIEGSDYRRYTDYNMDTAEGRYTFSNLKPGNYTITAIQGNLIGSVKVTISANASLNAFPSAPDIILSSTLSNVVRGLVTDRKSGEGLADAQVLLIGDNVKLETKTDSVGFYQFSNSPIGPVRIFATKANVGSNLISIQTPVDNGRVPAIPLIPLCLAPPISARVASTDSCQSQGSEAGTGRDFALIIDSSGSMGDTDPTNLRKQAAKLFTSLLEPQDKIAVVGFASSAYVVWSLDTVANSRDQIGQAIDSTIGSIGGTNISDGLKSAYMQLNDGSDRQKVAILLTDGQQDGAPYDPNWQTAFHNKGWPVYTFGLSNQADSNRLRDIATSTGGTFDTLSSASQLEAFYNRLRVKLTGSRQVLDQTVMLQQDETLLASMSVPLFTRVATFITAWPGSRVNTVIQAPDGTAILSGTNDPYISHTIEDSFEIYRVLYPQAGTWRVAAYGAELAPGGEPVTLQADISVMLHQVALPLVIGKGITAPPPATADIAPPTGVLRFLGGSPLDAGSNQSFEVALQAEEGTKWNAPAFTSDCGLTGLPSGFATDPLTAHTVTTQVYIPPDAAGKLCTITGTIMTYGKEYPQTTFVLSLPFRVVAPPSLVSITIPIRADNEDGYDDPTFHLSGDGNSMDYVGTDSSVMAGWVFTNVPIPQGAQIQSAYIRFRGFGLGGDATARILSYADDNPAPFLPDGSNSPSQRGLGDEQVDWSNIWTFNWQWFETPDISSLVQQQVNSLGWAPGNNIGFVVMNPLGTGTNWAVEDFAGGPYDDNGGAGHSVTLYVSYIVP